MRKKTAFRIYSVDVRAPQKNWCLGDIPPFVFQNQSDKIVAITDQMGSAKLNFSCGESPRLSVTSLFPKVIMSTWKKNMLSGWWLTYPSEKYESQMGVLFPIYGKIKNVCNHQPVKDVVSFTALNPMFARQIGSNDNFWQSNHHKSTFVSVTSPISMDENRNLNWRQMPKTLFKKNTSAHLHIFASEPQWNSDLVPSASRALPVGRHAPVRFWNGWTQGCQARPLPGRSCGTSKDMAMAIAFHP